MAHDQDPSYVLVAGILFPILCIITVALRFYTRHLQDVRLGVDDWLLVPALLMVIGCGASLIAGVALKVLAYPTPPPSDQQDPDDSISYNFTVVEQIEWGFFMMQILAIGFTKLSFVFFYRRIFVGGNPGGPFDRASIFAIIVLLLWVTAFFLWFLFSCGGSFAARWTTVAALHATCPTDVKSDLALAISDVITDILVLFLPIPMVLRLHTSPRRKVLILVIFALGTIAVVMSIVRLALFVNITELAAGIIQDPTADNDLLTTRGLYWSMLESGLALIACCLPTLYALARVPRLQSLIRSARSMASIGSSRKSPARRPVERSHGGINSGPDTNFSAASSEAMVAGMPDAAKFDTYAMGDVPKVSGERPEGNGEIWVDHTIEQRDSFA